MCNIKKCYQERSLTWVNKAGKSKIVDYTILLITYNTFILSNSGIFKTCSYAKFIYYEKASFLRSLHRRFVQCSNGQIYGGDFVNFFGLLRIYELYVTLYLFCWCVLLEILAGTTKTSTIFKLPLIWNWILNSFITT